MRPDQLSASKRTLKTSTTIVGLTAYVLLEDMFAGKRNRFTVYRIFLYGEKTAKIVGRELTPSQARKRIHELEGLDD